jgi:hypothetical protein
MNVQRFAVSRRGVGGPIQFATITAREGLRGGH